MCLPSHPHTSHIVQALDSTPFAQFKKNWQRLLLDYNFEHHGQVVGKGDFFKTSCTCMEACHDCW